MVHTAVYTTHCSSEGLDTPVNEEYLRGMSKTSLGVYEQPKWAMKVISKKVGVAPSEPRVGWRYWRTKERWWSVKTKTGFHRAMDLPFSMAGNSPFLSLPLQSSQFSKTKVLLPGSKSILHLLHLILISGSWVLLLSWTWQRPSFMVWSYSSSTQNKNLAFSTGPPYLFDE